MRSFSTFLTMTKLSIFVTRILPTDIENSLLVFWIKNKMSFCDDVGIKYHGVLYLKISKPKSKVSNKY